jgi:hypothetical protein
MDYRDLPPQPPDAEWGFIEELKAPLWTDHGWPPRLPRPQEADLRCGLRLECGLPDPDGLLDTAVADLAAFARAGRIPFADGYPVRIVLDALPEESFRALVGPADCVLAAGGTEGARRALFWLEDACLRAGGPFLPVGIHERRPFVTRRISRCFFGPIKRPPRLRDELLDEQDYYPENYLNRLAHEGINGLWLTVEFRDLCRTSFTPEYGPTAERRLAKLRRTVDACRRHGIRTYVFCIEPRAWTSEDAAVLERHPELARGGPAWDNRRMFCPFSEAAQQYLREAVGGLFSAVPHLGGLITISHGERPTTCLSALAATGEGRIQCPLCSRKQPWEILHATLEPMAQAMHAVAPDADLISWLYMPQPQGPVKPDVAAWVYDIPSHMPPGVILQFNFESGVRRQVFGKTLIGGDYWLSNPGPSDRFERIAESARRAGVRVSAKIQTGCSHEVATIPFVPIPGMIYRKFAALRRLGVSASMLCWYFGNYPGVMNQAAGELSCEPFPESEGAFLGHLAGRWWGDDAETVAEAWRQLAAGYEHYPLTNLFQYYGPMHDGPVWPLHLVPRDAPLSPTWLLASTTTREPWPPSGDRVGEAFGESLTLDEVVRLCQRIAEGWDRGTALLTGIAPRWQHSRDRLLDIGLAEALGIQFRSGYHILRFYQVREQMLRSQGLERLPLLAELEQILRREVAGDERLLELCAADSRLGFHSEAEGYKYFPSKIRWRMAQVRGVLDRDLPGVAAAIGRGEWLYPEYTGRVPTGVLAARCQEADMAAQWQDPGRDFPAGQALAFCRAGGPDPAVYETAWFACRRADALYVAVRCRESDPDALRRLVSAEPFPLGSWRGRAAVALRIEPRRLWPCLWFALSAGGGCSQDIGGSPEARVAFTSVGWQCVLRVPSERLGWQWTPDDPLRIDVQRSIPGVGVLTWMAQHPRTHRLCLGGDNPADLGWLLAP